MPSSPLTYHSAALDSRKRSRRRRSFSPPKMRASSPALNCSLTVAPSKSDVRDPAKRSMEKKMTVPELLRHNFDEIFIELDPVKRESMMRDAYTEDCVWIHPGPIG